MTATATRGLDAAVKDVTTLMGVSGQAVTVSFRGQRCTAVAQLFDPHTDRTSKGRVPVTDVLNLELISGSGEQPDWPRSIQLHAVIEIGRDAVRTVHRASRWASYAARVAIVPEERLTEQACLEAWLRGVWLITAGESSRVAVLGERGPVTGAARGLLHRLLDEIVAEVLSCGPSSAADQVV